MTRPLTIGIVFLVAMVAGPAWAEHRTLEPAPPAEAAVARDGASMLAVDDPPGVPDRDATDGAWRTRDLDLQLRLGDNAFRLGGRVMGPGGVAGAWLNGRVGDRGVHLDGRVQRPDGRAWNFQLDAEVEAGWPRLAWRVMRGAPVLFLGIR